MSNRLQFWLGLLLGAFAVLRLRLPKLPPPPSAHEVVKDILDGALVICDSRGEVIEFNGAAGAIFGPNCVNFFNLTYSTGQPLPPGQHPLIRAFEFREFVSGSYRTVPDDGIERVLETFARPLPGGGAAVVFRDLTAENISRTRQAESEARARIVQSLCRGLERAKTAEETTEAIIQQASRFFLYPLNVQVRLYSYSPAAQTLTCLASKPPARPKHPAKATQVQPLVFPFDARNEALWLLYLLRRPCTSSLTVLGEVESASAYAVPLVLGGVAIGHLGFACGTEGAFEDKDLQAALRIVATVAALALAIPQSGSLSSFLESQGVAVQKISQAVSAGLGESELADLVTGQIKRLLSAGVCTVSLFADGTLSVLGQGFTDDLLSPKTAPNAPRLHGKTVQKAFRTQKIAVQTGIVNPSLEAGSWRVFAGSSGCHSITALPLADRRGVLTVYTSGDAALPDSQIKFLQTIAALLSVSLLPATAKAGGAD